MVFPENKKKTRPVIMLTKFSFRTSHKIKKEIRKEISCKN